METEMKTNTVSVGLTFGEKGHLEYDWHLESKTADDLKERLVQLYFQLVRVDGRNKDEGEGWRGSGGALTLNKLVLLYKSLIEDTMRFGGRNIVSNREHLDFVCHMMMLLRALPTQTRDIVSGKGERTLGYHLLLVWETIDSAYIRRTLKYWLCGSDYDTATGAATGGAPPGCWKDVRNICSILKEQGGSRANEHPLIGYLIRLLSDQLQEDDSKEEDARVSLAAKWTPREGSRQFGWIFRRLAVELFGGSGGREYRLLRQTLARLNRRIDTTEIKQCGKHWADIDFKHVCSVTMQKQKRAFANLARTRRTRWGRRGQSQGENVRLESDEDRVLCAKHFEEHVGKAEKGETRVKATNTSLYDMVRDAIELTKIGYGGGGGGTDSIQYRTLEEQWLDNGRRVCAGLPPMVCMADVSGSMTSDKCVPLYNCIGLSLRATERTVSAFRNKIMTFSTSPSWVEFDDEMGFVKRVDKLQKADWGGSTNMYAGLNMILRILIQKEVPPSDVQNLVLAVFSDMQFNIAVSGVGGFGSVALESIQRKFVEAGYCCPHILFWNLRTTEGFPAVSSDENVTMVSGYSPVLLNVLEESGIEGLKGQTPFAMICKILENPRFTY